MTNNLVRTPEKKIPTGQKIISKGQSYFIIKQGKTIEKMLLSDYINLLITAEAAVIE